MALLGEDVRQALRGRFQERLRDPVRLTLHTRPGTGRLILPSGMGCATCDDARELAEALQEAAPETVALDVVDVSSQPNGVREVPTLALGRPDEDARIRWQGLPSGYEFATVVDAIERLSSGEHGLGEETMARLAAVAAPLEIMVFTTPT